MDEQPPSGFTAQLDDCFEKYFKPLIGQFGMKITHRFCADMGALCDAAAGSLVVRMVNDKGIVSFEIAPAGGEQQFWNVELICEMHGASTRKLKGHRRLSLHEQAGFIRNHWDALQRQFSARQIGDTVKALKKLSARRADQLLNG